MRIRRALSALLLPLLLALLLAPLAAPAMARGSAYAAVEGVYAVTGSVPPCRFTAGRLEAALHQSPVYDQEYTGLAAAIQTALNRRADGGCRTHSASTPAIAVTGPLPPAPPPPASLTAASGAGAPFALVAGAALLGAAVLLGGGLGLVRAGGWDPAWARALRHCWQEGEYRLEDVWDGARDRFSRSR